MIEDTTENTTLTLPQALRKIDRLEREALIVHQANTALLETLVDIRRVNINLRRRETELLEANNRYLERARAAEHSLREMSTPKAGPIYREGDQRKGVSMANRPGDMPASNQWPDNAMDDMA